MSQCKHFQILLNKLWIGEIIVVWKSPSMVGWNQDDINVCSLILN